MGPDRVKVPEPVFVRFVTEEPSMISPAKVELVFKPPTIQLVVPPV